MRAGAHALRPLWVPAAVVRRTASPLAPAPGCNKTLLALLILLHAYLKSHIVFCNSGGCSCGSWTICPTTCSSIALAQATRSGRRAIDDLAADHGRYNTRLANGLERYRKDVLRQDGEIRQLARFQCADSRVGKRLPHPCRRPRYAFR